MTVFPFAVNLFWITLNSSSIPHAKDIGTIRKRLRNNFIKAHECLANFQRMFCNAYTYNSPGSQLYIYAESLEVAFMLMLIERPRPEVEQTVPARGGRRERASEGENLSRVKKRNNRGMFKTWLAVVLLYFCGIFV
ncbi:unnamed protein product [Orchesella dallaii]|uniref:Bromo domain-containing protein n=1 Tax=Orchesella dallaii TaxID=48710 RepID=A0ABP1Q4P5_9HEXA